MRQTNREIRHIRGLDISCKATLHYIIASADQPTQKAKQAQDLVDCVGQINAKRQQSKRPLFVRSTQLYRRR